MEIDKRYYLQIFRTQHQELRADVVDYFMAFMRKRNSINRGINVEQIRKHCEYIIKKEIPMDYFLGALLYDGYTPRKIGDQYYLNLSERSPIIAIKNGRTSSGDKIAFDAIRQWYGDAAAAPMEDL